MGRHGQAWAGSPRGRYVRGDKCAACLGDEPRLSRLETEIFTLMNYVLDDGERDLPLPNDGRMHLDMRFRQERGPMIGVEYDGAYWHAFKEEADERKTRRVVSEGIADVVVRIREQPLTVLSPEDVVVPRNESPSTIAVVTLLHLVHIRVIDSHTARRVAAMLSASTTALPEEKVFCDDCWLLDGEFRRADPTSRWNDVARRRAARRNAARKARQAPRLGQSRELSHSSGINLRSGHPE